jgi:hypothetical protein
MILSWGDGRLRSQREDAVNDRTKKTAKHSSIHWGGYNPMYFTSDHLIRNIGKLT